MEANTGGLIDVGGGGFISRRRGYPCVENGLPLPSGKLQSARKPEVNGIKEGERGEGGCKAHPPDHGAARADGRAAGAAAMGGAGGGVI